MRFTEKDLELKKQEFKELNGKDLEKQLQGTEWKKPFGKLFTMEEMVNMTINHIVETKNPLTEERRKLVKKYMEYEFGDGTEERIDYIMGFVDEYDQENRITFDTERQICNDEDLMCYVQDRLIYNEENE